MSEIHNPKSRPGLTPSEIIRLGIQQGHSADVILASLEAAGWVVVSKDEIDELQGAVRAADWLDDRL